MKCALREKRGRIKNYHKCGEERAAELSTRNQQLMGTLAELEEKMAMQVDYYTENEYLKYELNAYSELLATNQQLMATLAE